MSYFGKKCLFRMDHLVTFIPPVVMYTMGSRDLLVVLKIWLFTLAVTSFLMCFIITTSGHHHPKVYHEGDELS